MWYELEEVGLEARRPGRRQLKWSRLEVVAPELELDTAVSGWAQQDILGRFGEGVQVKGDI